MLSNIEKCRLLAIVAHKGQTDKGGSPYIYHPAWVAEHVETEEEKCVAWLHDVIEDTDFTIADIKCLGLSKDVIDAVETITKKEDENYEEYIYRVAGNQLAKTVKMADLKHNMDKMRWESLREVTDKDRKRQKKYEHAFAILSL